jgi:hypothetical protein
LARVGGYTRAPTKSRKLRVYDSSRVCYLSCAHGFGVPSHRFLCSLLRSYGLELHHLTPLGILYMAAFMTLCEAYMNLWSHFFQVRLRQGLDAGAASLGSVDVLVHSGPEADVYFISLSDPPVGWPKAWLLLKNDADAPLPAFMGGCLVPFPTGSTMCPRLTSTGCNPC